MKAILINFDDGNKPAVDVDNMSKPIPDELQHLDDEDDRQIIQAKIVHLRINAAFSIVGVPMILMTALQTGS